MAIQDFKNRMKLLAETPLLRYPALVGDKLNYDPEKVKQFVQLTGEKNKDEVMVNILLVLRDYLLETPEEEIDYTFLEENFHFIARKTSIPTFFQAWSWFKKAIIWQPFEPPNTAAS